MKNLQLTDEQYDQLRMHLEETLEWSDDEDEIRMATEVLDLMNQTYGTHTALGDGTVWYDVTDK